MNGTSLSKLVILRLDFFLNWYVRFSKSESCLSLAGLGYYLMIVLYNWLEAIRKRDSLASFFSIKLMRNRKVSLSSIGSDEDLNAPITSLFVFLCIV